MGLTRQDFISHLILSNFRQSCFFFNSHTENPDIRLKLSNLLTYISQELMEEDERASHEEMENYIFFH